MIPHWVKPGCGLGRLLLWLGAIAVVSGCGRRAATSASPPLEREAGKVEQIDLEAVRPDVDKFCGACHAVPRPESFPRDQWVHEVDRGYEFYLHSGRSDLAVPRRSDVIAYYRTQAPDKLALPQVAGVEDSSRFTLAAGDSSVPLLDDVRISHLLALPGDDGSEPELVFCDMRHGAIRWLAFPGAMAGGRSAGRIVRKAQLNNPSHVSRTDLDADGQPDYVVCDLGSYLPEDHHRGRVVWLRPRSDAEGEDFETVVLLEGVGRVADARAADFDGDGDLDIVVAAFGLHATGNVLLLRQTEMNATSPAFTTEVLDPRTGAIHVPVADLNGDGRPDFVALFSQEHESIEAFLNRGDGSFDKEVLYRAPDPSYGSSGIQLADLDGDGDLDVVYTNGDTFDSFYLKPYHGVRWIENRGASGWQEHLLASLPGVMAAQAGDLDGDGDLDIAACCLLSEQSFDAQPEAARAASLVWLENRAGDFVRHDLEIGDGTHAALELADVNGDAALDIVVGNFGGSPSASLHAFDVWLNRPPAGQARSSGP